MVKAIVFVCEFQVRKKGVRSTGLASTLHHASWRVKCFLVLHTSLIHSTRSTHEYQLGTDIQLLQVQLDQLWKDLRGSNKFEHVSLNTDYLVLKPVSCDAL